MDKNLGKMWVKALRSGEYKQCKEALQNNNNEFCCLGVLADLVNVPTRKPDDNVSTLSQFYHDTRSYCFPLDVEFEHNAWPLLGKNGDPTVVLISKEFSDLKRSTTGYAELILDEHGQWTTTLSQLNDSGFTFKRIADIIERNMDKV